MVKCLRCLVALGMLLAAGGQLLAADTDELNLRMKDVEGTWRIVAQIRDGQPVPEDEYEGAKLIVEAGRFVVRRGDEVLSAGTFKLMDIVDDVGLAEVEFSVGSRSGEKIKQTSKLEAKTMYLCSAPFDSEWPKEFASTSANKCFLGVYKRVEH